MPRDGVRRDGIGSAGATVASRKNARTLSLAFVRESRHRPPYLVRLRFETE